MQTRTAKLIENRERIAVSFHSNLKFNFRRIEYTFYYTVSISPPIAPSTLFFEERKSVSFFFYYYYYIDRENIKTKSLTLTIFKLKYKFEFNDSTRTRGERARIMFVCFL